MAATESLGVTTKPRSSKSVACESPDDRRTVDRTWHIAHAKRSAHDTKRGLTGELFAGLMPTAPFCFNGGRTVAKKKAAKKAKKPAKKKAAKKK